VKLRRHECKSTGGARRLTRGVLVTAVAGASSLGVVGLTGPAGAAVTTGPACQTPTPVTATQASSTTGLTSKSVTVGNVSILTGPVEGLFAGAPIGVAAYFDYLNSKGGVNGRKLRLDGYDDAFSGQANASETATAIAKDFALVGSFSLFDNYGCKALAANGAVPDVSVTLDPGTNSLPNDFSADPLAQGAATGPLQYLRTTYPKVVKVGSLVSNVSTATAQWQGEQAALQKVGYKIAYYRPISPIETDFTTDIINMRNDGVQMVYMTGLDWQIAAAMVQAMTQQNWHPLLFSGGPVYADQFISTAGGPSAVNGLWLGQTQALYLGQDAKTVPAVKTFLSWVQKAHPGFTPDLYTLFGWSSAQLFAQALQAAGKNPTRGAVLSQLKKIQAFNSSGLLAPANPAKKLPPSCYVLAKIVNGTYQRVADPPNGGFRCDGVYWSVKGPLPSVTSAG